MPLRVERNENNIYVAVKMTKFDDMCWHIAHGTFFDSYYSHLGLEYNSFTISTAETNLFKCFVITFQEYEKNNFTFILLSYIRKSKGFTRNLLL